MPTFRKILGRHKATDSTSPQIRDVAASSSKSTFTTGLMKFYEDDDPIADVIFIHGLTGDREKTWTADGADEPWPKELLPGKIQPARVLTFGYDASVVDYKSMISKNRIGNHSMNLLAAVATYRENDETNNRPIIFVAHSLGGLVCQDALLASNNSADQHLQNILECTRAILFLGTPHAGSGLARWAELFAKSLGLIKQTNSRIIEVLKSDSEVLARIKDAFHLMIRARALKGERPIGITCCYEELPMPGIGEVVPMHSAILPGYVPIGIHRNHLGMTKFVSEDDPGFVAVAGELRRWMKEIKTSPGWAQKQPLLMIPFERDPHFVGREDVLLKINELSKREKRIALAGIGGVGKSQIAIEHCYRFSNKNPNSHVFWVNGNSVQRFEQAYAEISRRLELPGWEDPKVNKLELVSDWLNDKSHESWMLLLDNTDNESVFFNTQGPDLSQHVNTTPLIRYIPQTANGLVLFTSRNRNAAFRLTNNVETIIDIPLMDEESSKLVLKRKLPQDQSTESDILELVKMLDNLPLAIAQAAAFIGTRRPRMTVARYLASLRENERILLEDMGDLRRDPDMPNSVIKTWQVSFDQIKKDHPKAAELFSLMSVLDRQGLPDYLFSTRETDLDFEDNVAPLIEFSLLNSSVDGRTFGMHRLVQIAMRSWLNLHGETQKWKDKALNLFYKSFPYGCSYEEWRRCETLLPHADVVLGYQYDKASQCLMQTTVKFNTASYLYSIGKVDLAQGRFQQTLDIRSRFLNEGHPEILDSVESLASSASGIGLYEQALELWQEALHWRLKEEDASEDALYTMDGLSVALHSLGRLDDAEEMARRVVKTSQDVLGKEHTSTLRAIIKLAGLLQEQGKEEEAEIMLRQTVSLQYTDDASSSLDYERLRCLSNLSEILRTLKSYQQAEKIGLSTLTGLENLLGPNHHRTLDAARRYAATLYEIGKGDLAELMVLRVLSGDMKLRGGRNPNTLCDLTYLSTIQRSQGRLELAEENGLQALKGSQEMLGDEHLDTIDCKEHLARTYWAQNRDREAVSTLTDALKGYQKFYRKGHPRISQVKDDINTWQREAGMPQSRWDLEIETSEASAEESRQEERRQNRWSEKDQAPGLLPVTLKKTNRGSFSTV